MIKIGLKRIDAYRDALMFKISFNIKKLTNFIKRPRNLPGNKS